MGKNRIVFLSFLGIGNYVECVYANDAGQHSKVVMLIQHALTELFGSNWTDAYIFTTEAAYHKHWERLKKGWSPNIPIQNVFIPDGKDENEIWDIFQTIFDTLQQGDEVYFDITHSFRSLPLLTGSLLQYAKSLKRITVKEIFYGAFESMPTFQGISTLETDIPDPAERVAPIFNLSTFSQILDWSNAAYDFIENGNSMRFCELTMNDLTPILRKPRGSDETAKEIETAQEINCLIKNIDNLCLNLKTVRGRRIIEGVEAENIKNILTKLEQAEDLYMIAPLKPILDELKNSVIGMDQELDNYNNMLNAVKWCIDKQLIQEGLTLLQEGILSLCIEKDSLTDKRSREFISSYLQCIALKKEFDWTKSKISEEQISYYTNRLENQKELARLFENIAGVRNDINHAGMTETAMGSNSFAKKLEDLFESAKKIVIAP